MVENRRVVAKVVKFKKGLLKVFWKLQLECSCLAKHR